MLQTNDYLAQQSAIGKQSNFPQSATPIPAGLSAKCTQLEDRVHSLMGAVGDLQSMLDTLIGHEPQGTGSGGQVNPKDAPPVALRFSQSLEDLANVEGYLRTQLKRLEVAL